MSRSSSADPAEPRLSPAAADRARLVISERIEKGIRLRRAAVDDPMSAAVWYEQWTQFNQMWIARQLGPFAAGLYEKAQPMGASRNRTAGELSAKIECLRLIAERIDIWTYDSETPPNAGIAAGAGFVVHGHDVARALEVADLVRTATGRDAWILRDLPNKGRTVIEKFEDYADDAAFAVIVLTADDVGRARAEDKLQPRGRQNVIFELGFFFGKLHRSRVVVLVDKDVERPSDVAGLMYTVLDEAGTWRSELLRELEAAGIEVDFSAVAPGPT